MSNTIWQSCNNYSNNNNGIPRSRQSAQADQSSSNSSIWNQGAFNTNAFNNSFFSRNQNTAYQTPVNYNQQLQNYNPQIMMMQTMMQMMMTMFQSFMMQMFAMQRQIPSTSTTAPDKTPVTMPAKASALNQSADGLNLNDNAALIRKQATLLNGKSNEVLEKLASQINLLEPGSAQAKQGNTVITSLWKSLGGNTSDNSLKEYIALQGIKDSNTARQSGSTSSKLPVRADYPSTTEGDAEYATRLAAYEATFKSRTVYNNLVKADKAANAPD